MNAAPEAVRAIADDEIIRLKGGDGDWLSSWHPPDKQPLGAHYGPFGLCITPDRQIVLITQDGERWSCPGGRTEPSETLEQNLSREVLEEACARVERAVLLGFLRNECVSGARAGLVEVRSFWRAEVEVLDWAPQFETLARRLEPPERAWAIIRDTNPDTVRLPAMGE